MRVYRIARRYTDDDYPFSVTESTDAYAIKERERAEAIDRWHGPHAGPATKATWNYSKPTPDADKPAHIIKPEEVCGCMSIEQLLEWFGACEYTSYANPLKTMAEEGFRLLTIYIPLKSRHVIQKEQIVFRWADAVIVKDEPVSVLIKEDEEPELVGWEKALAYA